jgi:serine protease
MVICSIWLLSVTTRCTRLGSILFVCSIVFLTVIQGYKHNYTLDIDDDTAYKKLFYAQNEELAIPDGFIVVFNKSRIDEIQNNTLMGIVSDLSTSGGAIIVEKVHSFVGMVKVKVNANFSNSSDKDSMKHERARRLLPWLKNSLVDYMEEDQAVATVTNQRSPPWGLDRIDQDILPNNNLYHFDNNGTGVTVYILDTGIRARHNDFGGRATCPISFVQFEDCEDKNGHGTHVAGTIGSNTFGVAKGVSLIGIKVLSNEGSGVNSGVINGIEYVLQEALADTSNRPRVCNLSLGGVPSRALDRALAQLSEIGNVVTVVAAGNEAIDACLSSPARASTFSNIISVGAIDSTDRRASFSNFGKCVTIFAPGVDIESTWFTSDVAINKISGTSMASPHVAGVTALFREENPNVSPREIKQAVLNSAVLDVLFDVLDSPNALVNTESLFELLPASPEESSAKFYFATMSCMLIPLFVLLIYLL